MTLPQLFEIAGLGLGAGIVGGLAGIGGSLIMLPGLALLIGYRDAAQSDHHVYMAAAMAVNVAVGLSASWRHSKAGAVRADLVRVLMPSMVVAIVAGVLISNRVSGGLLKVLLAAFIAGYCCWNIARLIRSRSESERRGRPSTPVVAGIGAGAGLAGGLLGIGGGAVVVPALQLLAGVPLRQAIGTSNAAMIGSALVGATLKFSTLSHVGRSWAEAALLAAAMAPGAILGATAGASLAHALPLKAVRLTVSCLLLLVAVRLLLSK